jgi:hypothetical protein
MLTIEDLLKRHHVADGYTDYISNIWFDCVTYSHVRMEVWAEILEAKQQGLRKVPALLNKVYKYRSEMDADELELLDSLIAEQHKEEANGNLSWTRISLHMDTLDMWEKASKAKKMSKSEVAEIAIREYCKAIGIEQ